MNMGSGESPHNTDLGAPRSSLKRNSIISQGDKIRIPKKGDSDLWGRKGRISSPLWPMTLGPWRASHQPPPRVYKGGEALGAATLRHLLVTTPKSSHVSPVRAWRSPAEIPLPPPPPHHRVGSDLIYLLSLTCWINKERTSSS